MAKMRKIQPRLKDLKEKFADDRQRFNTENDGNVQKGKSESDGGVSAHAGSNPRIYILVLGIN